MSILLMLVLIFVVLLAFLLGLSVGIAILLHWLLPAVGLEMALLISVIAIGQVMLLFRRLLGTLPPYGEAESEAEPPIVILDRELTLPRRRRKRS